MTASQSGQPKRSLQAPFLVPDPRTPVSAPGLARPALLPALTSVRFLAAFQVLLYHFFPNRRYSGPWSWLIGSGYTGVCFFFVLSGFILVYSHASEYLSGRGSPQRFYFARFARVYPIYFGAILVTCVFEWRNFLKPVHFLALFANLLLIQGWSVKTVIFLLAPSWTLSCEAFFYLTFPFLILRLQPATIFRALAGIGLAWLLAMVAPAAYLIHTYGLHYQQWIPERDNTQLVFVQFTPLLALPEFLAGMLTGWIVLRFPPSPVNAARLTLAAAALILLGLAASNHLPFIALHDGLLLPAYAAAIAGLSQHTPLARLLSARPLVLLGEASFALYLYHWFFAWYFPNPSFWSAAWKIVVSILLSIVIHLAVERPARKRLLQWWNVRHPRVV